MGGHIRSALVLLGLMTLLTGLAYPLVVTGIAQVIFPRRANGSLILKDGQPAGSELIGQSFTSDRFFHSRPSAAGKDGYDPTASGGTNFGPTSKKLRDAIAAAVGKGRDVPADAVTSSASGLDPHISPANAYAQAARVARANRMSKAAVRALIERHIEPRFLGVYGEPRVNVLALNLELAK